MYLKTGLYRGQWKSENFTRKVLFIDEVRMGDQDAGYDDIAPQGTPTT